MSVMKEFHDGKRLENIVRFILRQLLKPHAFILLQLGEEGGLLGHIDRQECLSHGNNQIGRQEGLLQGDQRIVEETLNCGCRAQNNG
jgi:hypothetical protein